MEDAILNLIQARLKDAGMSYRQASLAIGMHERFISEVMRKKQNMGLEERRKLARVLKLQPKVLEADMDELPASPSGFSEPAKLWTPPPGHFLAGIKHITTYTIPDLSLDQMKPPLLPGMVLMFNLTKNDPTHISIGAVVLVNRGSRQNLIGGMGSHIRIFMPPDKLMTNSSGANEIESLDDPGKPYLSVIMGTMAGVVSDIEASNGHIGP